MDRLADSLIMDARVELSSDPVSFCVVNDL